MPRRAFPIWLLALFALLSPYSDAADSGKSLPAIHQGPACGTTDDYFADEVWPKVAARTCLECHKPGGDADDSKFVLQDPARDTDPGHAVSLEHNRAAFARMALTRKNDQSRLLLKATGGLSHGGEEAVKPDSSGYRILAEFVRRAGGSPMKPAAEAAKPDLTHFFDGIAMMDDRRLLRRVTLSLAGRLPKPEELDAVGKHGLPALREILRAVMKEDVFYERLGEAFNDIFLVRGFDGNAETALSYNNFSETRLWYQKWDLTHIANKDERTRAGYKLANDYREAFLREPLELIKYIVRNDRPFTEVITADYIMESPYTARGYGNFEALANQFHDFEDPFDFIPAKLPALKSRAGPKAAQPSETGLYPHAGILSTFQYLRRYPTTETNRNRLRGRMYYQQFLGIDVLELAARVKDAAAVTAKFEIPTMQAAECVVCHRTLDPVAGIFQDYYDIEGVYGPRKDGWYKDMFGAGFEGEDLPAEQKWRSMPWLAERTVKDPRFANTMVEHVYYILTGRKALLAPKGIDDPLYEAKLRGYRAQHAEVERIAARLVQSNFNLKEAFQEWIASPFYRAEAPDSTELTPQRRAELADIGVAHLLGPEQLERKLAAIFGKPWGRLKQDYAMLYGGIDSREVTERATDPSGAMGAMQRMMADDVACKNTAADFALPAAQRRLFPTVETDVLPGESPEADQRVQQTIVHLHELILGRSDAPESAEVARTYELFAGIVEEARSRKIDPAEIYSCRISEQVSKDPQYTMRA